MDDKKRRSDLDIFETLGKKKERTREGADLEAQPRTTSSMPTRVGRPPAEYEMAATDNGPEPSSLSGQFGAIGAPTKAAFQIAPPPSTQPFGGPPPAPPGQTTTPMDMPMRSAPPPLFQQPAPAVGSSRAFEPTIPRSQPSSRLGLWIALVASVLVAIGVSVLYFKPRYGALVVNVADAKGSAVSKLQVVVDGKRTCESAPCVFSDLPTGIHQVKVVAQGFESPAPRAVTIESSKSEMLDFALQPSKGGGTGFKVTSSQPGVKVFVDTREVGPLPQEIRDLAPGEHKIRFVGDNRYAALEKTIRVGDSEIVDLGNVTLQVLKGRANIRLGTPGAKVHLVSGTNRKIVSQFPIAIDFGPNEKWELQATKDGFERYSQGISFDDGIAEKTFTVTLTPKGEDVATSARTGTPPPRTAAAEPKADKKDVPARGEGFLNINSIPASSVVLDGKPLGPTPRLHVPVAPGEHTVTFVNTEEWLKKTITVKVGAGETAAAVAKLRAE